MKTSIVNTYLYCFLYLVLSLTTKTQAQGSITDQVLPFDRICAGVENHFDATFTYSGFPAGTTFEVILSDPSGNFANPVTTTTLSSADTGSQKTITFAVPTNLIGSDNYKLRVKSSTGISSGNFRVKDPINIGGTLTFFPAYYKSFEGAFFINDKKSTATICSGGSVILSIDNPTPGIPNSSPINYPNLRYKWFRGNNILISGQTGPSISVNTSDTYYVQLDYGLCSDANFRSNAVTVIQSAGGGAGFVSSSLGNPICSGGAFTILSSITGNTYQWYKDNVKINNATNATYSTNQAGYYSVKIDFGGCASTYNIDLKGFDANVKSSINIPENPIVNDIREGDTKIVVVTTNAKDPSFEWYKENVLIPDNNTNTYEVVSGDTNEEINYFVKVISQNSGCIIVNENHFIFKSKVIPKFADIPNLISPNNDGINDNWNIPEDEYITDTKTHVVIMDANGEVVFTTDNYKNNYSNSPDPNNWPNSNNPINFKSVNPVYYYIITKQDGGVKQGSITIVN